MIPVNEPLISKEAKQFVNMALRTGWISSSGEFVEKFERSFAKYVGMKYGICVSSGTAALHIALLALGIGPGDEVIVPAFTMAATWLAVLYIGAKPVFVDCEPDTFNIDPNLIERKLTKKTRAIIPVHIYGHPADMDPILKLAKKHNLYVIEDAAEAHGAEYKGKKCGSMGIISCFSFYANKIVTTGEGGMVLTNNINLSEKLKRFKDLCHSKKMRFIHDGIGYNYRMTNLQAAVGCGQLIHIREYIRLKQKMAGNYRRLLKDIPGVKLPATKSWAKNVYWMYSILINEREFGMSKDELREELMEEGIETRDFFYAPKKQPILKKYLERDEAFPVTERIENEGMYIPSGLAITAGQMKKVAEAFRRIYSENSSKYLLKK